MVINIHDGNGNEGAPDAGNGGGCGSGGCSSGTCGNGLEKIYPTAAVRYGYMKQVGEFRYPTKDMKFGCGAKVIIQSKRGIEFGEMVSLTCDGCDKCVSRDQIRSYIEASGPDYFSFDNGKIMRLATPDDVAEWDHIRADTLRKKSFCQTRADEKDLPLKVIECEHLFGGERIIFFFMAEGRVDFRSLVRELAEEYQTRIEMRQVGARDEARLLADYETCGRECCCKNFLKTLKPISMKMAKMQKATLDPAKVSGRCGRLKCCLRYEQTTYEELDRKLPRIGAHVNSSAGSGVVVARQILTQLIQVQTEDGGRATVPLEDIFEDGRGPAPGATKRLDTQPVDEPDIEPADGEQDMTRPTDQPPAEDSARQADRRETRGRDAGEQSRPDGQSGRRRRGRRRPGSGPTGQAPAAGDQAGGGQPGGGQPGGSQPGGDGKRRRRRGGRRRRHRDRGGNQGGDSGGSPPSSE